MTLVVIWLEVSETGEKESGRNVVGRKRGLRAVDVNCDQTISRKNGLRYVGNGACFRPFAISRREPEHSDSGLHLTDGLKWLTYHGINSRANQCARKVICLI